MATSQSERYQAKRLRAIETALREVREQMLAAGYGTQHGAVTIPTCQLGMWQERLRMILPERVKLAQEEEAEARNLELLTAPMPPFPHHLFR